MKHRFNIDDKLIYFVIDNSKTQYIIKFFVENFYQYK